MAQELNEAAEKLAVLGLQSQRYVDDPDYKDAVDAVLHMTILRPANEPRPISQCPVILHPGTERQGSRCVLKAGHDGKCMPPSQRRTLATDIAEDR